MEKVIKEQLEEYMERIYIMRSNCKFFDKQVEI